MAWLRQIWNTFRLGALDRELEEEVRYHLDLRARDLELSSMGAEAARAEAARQFGNCTLEKERMRDMDISSWIETIFKDVQYAFRQLRRNPGFTAVAVASLALGIGPNTAIFSALDAALLRVLPVRNPRELVMLTDPNTSGIAGGIETGDRSRLTYAEFVQLRDHSTTLSGMCASETLLERWMVGIGGSTPEYVRGRLVTEGYFSVLGVEPEKNPSVTRRPR